MFHTWQLQEAKNRFSEVIERAVKSGPQVITKRGAQVAILLSYAEYRKLVARQQTCRVSQFFRESPLTQVPLDLRRDRSPVRRGPAL